MRKAGCSHFQCVWECPCHWPQHSCSHNSPSRRHSCANGCRPVWAPCVCQHASVLQCACVCVCGHLREPLHPGLREHVLYQLLRCSLASGGNREISMWSGGHRAGRDKAGNPVYDVAVGGPSSDGAEGGQQTHLNQPGWAPVLKGKRVHPCLPRGAETHCTESVYVHTDTHTQGHSLDGTERLHHPNPGPVQQGVPSPLQAHPDTHTVLTSPAGGNAHVRTSQARLFKRIRRQSSWQNSKAHTCARTHTHSCTHTHAPGHMPGHKLAKFVLHTLGCAWSRWECERERLCTHNAPPL